MTSSAITQSLTRWFRAESRTQKAFLNSAASALDHGAHLLVSFVVNPLLVSGLGPQLFGLWQVLRQLVGYAAPASGRPSQALKWMIAKDQGSQDVEAKRRYVGSTLVLWLAFLPILSGIAGILVWLAPLLLDIPADLSATARWAGALIAANLITMTLVEIPRAVLGGENLAFKRMGLSALLVLSGGGLTLGALHLDLGLVGVAACPAITSLLTGILFVGVARRHVPWFGVARPTGRGVRAFLQVSGWFLAWRLVMLGMRASDLVVLGAFDSVERVTTYTLMRYVPEALVLLVVIVVSGLLPGLGGILGAGQVERARGLHAEMLSASWLMTSVVGTTIVLWNPSFVGLWVGPEHFEGSLPGLLVVLLSAQFVVIRVDANIIDLTLDLRAKVLVGALSALLSVGLAALLLERFSMGLTGLCLGFLAGRGILSLAYPRMVGRLLGVSAAQQLRGAVRPMALTVVLFAVAFELEPRVAAEGWLDLALGAASTASAVTLLAFFGGLSRLQRQRLLDRLRR
jgi:O-antigen/teichoic acid export membrane protein